MTQPQHLRDVVVVVQEPAAPEGLDVAGPTGSMKTAPGTPTRAARRRARPRRASCQASLAELNMPHGHDWLARSTNTKRGVRGTILA